MHSRAEKREEVLAALKEIVDAAPDTTASCTYYEWVRDVAEPQPVCIVGHLIKRLEPETFQAMVDADASEAEGQIAGVVIENLRQSGIHLSFDNDRDLIFALAVLQGEQDGGKTWVEAYHEFKTTLNQLTRISEGRS